jgi:hypothetical protein
MRLLRKVHTYAGLLTFINLAVYGIVGLSALFPRPPGSSVPEISYQSFTVQPNLTDLQVAEQVARQLNLTLAMPVHSFVIGHDEANHLVLDLRHANGRHLVTVFEKEGKIHIEKTRNRFVRYLFILHETTAAFHSGDWRMQFWADYNEFAMWSLLVMLLSGFAMFLADRMSSRLARISLAAGCCAFAALYFWTR